ncbi:uncharacterized protein LDX57_013019 [Aspergillus melleus]|uniref:uncharacterized protein n=1 Tax=Aspergillus melleus TaxID=138277 RepID=UPI001E8E4E35|nr:uncharacterized protein LDX57_013019 [Aspergillus melleus]KAH8435389.1 hypothetical protein LDX57_013019 [Aspergillus melleus]
MHEQRGDDIQSLRAPHLNISIKNLCQNLYPGMSKQQKRIKKARISSESLYGWKWKLLKNVALILSLVNANVKGYERKAWKTLEVDAINAYMQTLPQFGILDDLEKAWESVVTFYRGSHQQRVQASDHLLIPTNAQGKQSSSIEQYPVS